MLNLLAERNKTLILLSTVAHLAVLIAGLTFFGHVMSDVVQRVNDACQEGGC